MGLTKVMIAGVCIVDLVKVVIARDCEPHQDQFLLGTVVGHIKAMITGGFVVGLIKVVTTTVLETLLWVSSRC